ncbi:hypothetical protein [Halobacteriovorax sp. YZS-1-2]|uniref:hypothetical protein n=1 Tax=Halobacteriovorax sp. YZS-1-2 TaxID=3391177 RepID=UPI003999D8BD
MRDEEYLNILSYGRPTGTITVEPHPEDIIVVDPAIIANMKARLSGNDHSGVYDYSDRVIDEVSLMREKNKLKRIFGSESQVREAFSSIKNIKTIQEEIKFEDVDRSLLSDYAFVKSRESNVDEVDFYRSFLFETELISKEKRIEAIDDSLGLSDLFADYKMKHFDVLKASREVIQMSSRLSELFKERKLVPLFDEFLREFYGKKI